MQSIESDGTHRLSLKWIADHSLNMQHRNLFSFLFLFSVAVTGHPYTAWKNRVNLTRVSFLTVMEPCLLTNMLIVLFLCHAANCNGTPDGTLGVCIVKAFHCRQIRWHSHDDDRWDRFHTRIGMERKARLCCVVEDKHFHMLKGSVCLLNTKTLAKPTKLSFFWQLFPMQACHLISKMQGCKLA